MKEAHFLEVYQRLKGRRWRIDVVLGRIYSWSWGAGQWLEVSQDAAFKFWQEEPPCAIHAWARSLEARVFRNATVQADAQADESDGKTIDDEEDRDLEDAIPL